MKNIRCLLAFTVILLCICSCKKKDNDSQTDPPLPISYPNYSMLKPGNYWVYEDYQLDSATGLPHALGTFDSSYVEKDTVINGRTYYKYWDVNYRGPRAINGSPAVFYLRDSLSYLVTSDDYVLFSSADFTTVFYTLTGADISSGDSMLVTRQMGFKDFTTITDAGSFKNSTLREVYKFTTGPKPGRSVEYDYKYGLNVGLVSYTTAVYSMRPEVFERRLLRYHLQ